MNFTLDNSIENVQQRKEIVEKICAKAEELEEELSSAELERLANYLIYSMDKAERRERKILTDSRKATIDKNELSYEGLQMAKVDTDISVESLVREDKNQRLTVKNKITKKDLENIPDLLQIREAIKIWKSIEKKNYIINQAIIDLSKSQYLVKDSFYAPVQCHNYMNINMRRGYNYGALTLSDPDHVKALLRNYTGLKMDNYEHIQEDIHWIMFDLENLIDEVLKDDYPILYQIIIDKIDNLDLIKIKKDLMERFDVSYSIEHISSIYNNTIPKILATYHQKKMYCWQLEKTGYNNWKVCSHCGKRKPMSTLFFSKNSSKKNSYYSICKDCRKKKKKVK